MGDGCDNTSLLWTPLLLIIATGGRERAQRLEQDWCVAWHASLSRTLNAAEISAQTTMNRPQCDKNTTWQMADGRRWRLESKLHRGKKKKNTIFSPFLNEGCAANKHENNPFKRRKARLGYSGSAQISFRLDMLFCHIQSSKERQEGCRLECSALVSW